MQEIQAGAERIMRLQQREQAMKYYLMGVPSSTPEGNPFKKLVEEHRWRYHDDPPHPDCPVCQDGITNPSLTLRAAE